MTTPEIHVIIISCGQGRIPTINIFFLDYNPTTCAEAMCDPHVVKMVLETAQLLSAAHHEHQSPQASSVYKLTHRSHPSAVWARASVENYSWLWQHFVSLSDEYTFRFKREHKAFINTFMYLEHNPCKQHGLTVPPAAVSDDLKPSEQTWANVVLAYREYYKRDKRQLLRYNNGRRRPSWL